MSNILAIAQKELKSYFASPIAYVVIGFFAFVYGYFYWVILAYFVRAGMQMNQFGPQTLNINEQLIRPLLSNVTVVVLFVMPMVTMRTYAEEKRSGTIELLLTSPVTDLQIITGQKPSVRKAKKSIATFKLREGNEIGAKVTMRGDRMWEFYDRLVSLAIPRIRDFRGMSPTQFDGRGNYTFGLTEQLVFPEIDYDNIDTVRGMDITIVTTATSDDQGRALLRALGFPFRRDGQQG